MKRKGVFLVCMRLTEMYIIAVHTLFLALKRGSIQIACEIVS